VPELPDKINPRGTGLKDHPPTLERAVILKERLQEELKRAEWAAQQQDEDDGSQLGHDTDPTAGTPRVVTEDLEGVPAHTVLQTPTLPQSSIGTALKGQDPIVDADAAGSAGDALLRRAGKARTPYAPMHITRAAQISPSIANTKARATDMVKRTTPPVLKAPRRSDRNRAQ
jgi:hypothetical protein